MAKISALHTNPDRTVTVEYDDGTMVLQGPKPAPYMVWHSDLRAWADVRTNADLRATQWEKLKKSRDSAEYGGFVWDGSTFDSDLTSQSRIQGASQMAILAKSGEQAFLIEWTLADNSIRTLNADEMIGVGMAMGMHITAVHTQGRAKREEINNATTVEEIEAVAW